MSFQQKIDALKLEAAGIDNDFPGVRVEETATRPKEWGEQTTYSQF